MLLSSTDPVLSASFAAEHAGDGGLLASDGRCRLTETYGHVADEIIN